MRWIVLSEPYGLSSQMTKRNEADDPTLGARPMFSHFYLRQMEAEAVVRIAAGGDGGRQDGAGRRGATRCRERWLRQFNTAFGTDDGGEATTFNGSIPQALTLMNGAAGAAGDRQPAGQHARAGGRRIRSMDNAGEDPLPVPGGAVAAADAAGDHAVSNELLAARDGDVGAALQDIWWALLNSNEFILIH